MLTIKQLEEKLRKLYEEFGDPKLVGQSKQEFRENFTDYFNVKPLKDSDFEVVDWGNAGDGNESWCVLRYNPTGQLFGWIGEYSSWDCSYWQDEMKFMKTKKVIQYVAA